mmetsp:Transcript_14663/g.37220  ORF Transcript_14663/g.37220 Transcript_14663/m.37220 type:complete len:218 (-) Transcript_14663:760-1413(-)
MPHTRPSRDLQHGRCVQICPQLAHERTAERVGSRGDAVEGGRDAERKMVRGFPPEPAGGATVHERGHEVCQPANMQPTSCGADVDYQMQTVGEDVSGPEHQPVRLPCDPASRVCHKHLWFVIEKLEEEHCRRRAQYAEPKADKVHRNVREPNVLRPILQNRFPLAARVDVLKRLEELVVEATHAVAQVESLPAEHVGRHTARRRARHDDLGHHCAPR